MNGDETIPERPWSLNFNTADKNELRNIKGIGDVIASRIIAEREERPFRAEMDLVLRVAGITYNFLARVKETHS